MLDRIRLRYGMFWRSHRPGIADFWQHAKTALLFALILIAYGIVGRMDYEEELRQEAAAAKAAEQHVLDCLNGQPLGSYDRPKRSANDFGKVVILCKVEELAV